jgi:hypothetical protein
LILAEPSRVVENSVASDSTIIATGWSMWTASGHALSLAPNVRADLVRSIGDRV